MKRLFLFFVANLTMACGFAQSTNIKDQIKSMTESLTEDQKDVLFALSEQAMIAGVDSIMYEGRFLDALDLMDSIQVNWKSLTGRQPSPRMYLKKGTILGELEEWRDLIKTTEECLSVHKSNITDGIAAIMYDMQGYAHQNLEEFREAIHSFEDALYFYTKTGGLASQGNILCCMAKCYGKLGKHTMASSFYEKGINKFLDYFGTSRTALLRTKFSVKDSYKQAALGVFAAHLLNLSVYEQNYGSRLNSKDYLLMSAHCGNEMAISEYQRIYGFR